MMVKNVPLSKAMEEVAAATRGSFIMVGEEEVSGLIPYHQNGRSRVRYLRVCSEVTPAAADAILAKAGWHCHFSEFGGRIWYSLRY